jgi:predicted dehydrogenase
MPSAPIRLALIGAGRWGRNYIRTIAGLDGAELVAVASGNPETAGLVPQGCRIVSDWREIVGNGGINGVVVATPPSLHTEILLAAIRSGLPILIEKPVCLTLAEVGAIRAALAERAADILIDHIHLFHPAFRELQRRAAQLGPIRGITSSAGNKARLRSNVSVLQDWAPHDLSMCLNLLPGPARVSRAIYAKIDEIDGARAEEIEFELALAGSVVASVRLSTLAEQHRWFAVQFDACTLVYRDRGPFPLLELEPGAPVTALEGTPIPVGNEFPLTRAVLDFCDLVRNPTGNRASIELGLEVVELTAAIQAALERG